MKTFQIKASSWVIYTITTPVIGTMGVVLIRELSSGNSSSRGFDIRIIILLALTIYLSWLFGTARTVWTIAKNEIRLEWVSQFIFHKRPDLTISWDDIAAYQFRSARTFDLFKIKLKDGRVVRLWHENLFTKDDFMEFVDHFKELVKAHNEAEIAKNGIIS